MRDVIVDRYFFGEADASAELQDAKLITFDPSDR